jgi:UrcA family protein
MKTAHVLRTLALAAVLALPALPASAQDGVWKKTRDGGYAIEFASLDLSQPEDRQNVLRVVKRAAKKICQTTTSSIRFRRCQEQVFADTVAKAAPLFQEAIRLALTEPSLMQQAMR